MLLHAPRSSPADGIERTTGSKTEVRAAQFSGLPPEAVLLVPMPLGQIRKETFSW
jgi:hypothetical protein